MSQTRTCPVCGVATPMTGQHECAAIRMNQIADALAAETRSPLVLEQQVAGDHYVKYAVQPVEFIRRNGIPYIEGCIIKYVVRHRDKGGVEDLRKARHFLDMLIEEYDREG